MIILIYERKTHKLHSAVHGPAVCNSPAYFGGAPFPDAEGKAQKAVFFPAGNLFSLPPPPTQKRKRATLAPQRSPAGRPLLQNIVLAAPKFCRLAKKGKLPWTKSARTQKQQTHATFAKKHKLWSFTIPAFAHPPPIFFLGFWF